MMSCMHKEQRRGSTIAFFLKDVIILYRNMLSWYLPAVFFVARVPTLSIVKE